MAPNTAIVFGPTGGVGSVVARTAHELGASKVILAMRDPQKAIPSLNDLEQQKIGAFERVQADLMQPETVRSAVEKTSAKNAFIYASFGSQDGMRGTIEALKSGGVDFVVMLSSFGVQGSAKDVQQSQLVPFAHARVEVNLEEVFGKGHFIAVRPCWFTSNIQWSTKQLVNGNKQVKILYPDVDFDWICPEDIGGVSAALLVKGPSEVKSADGQSTVVYLCGPQLLSQKEAASRFAKKAGMELNILGVDEEEGKQMYVAGGMPEPVANYLVANQTKRVQGEYTLYEDPIYGEARGNVQRFTGKEPMQFDEWLDRHHAMLIPA
ncbi:MAG: hypothetical protein Q9227_007193 [Pyrenula ochraceoflavens]